MSAQKTALVCLVLFTAFVANGVVELMARTRAVVSVSGDRVEVSVCVRGDAAESCAIALEVESSRQRLPAAGARPAK